MKNIKVSQIYLDHKPTKKGDFFCGFDSKSIIKDLLPKGMKKCNVRMIGFHGKKHTVSELLRNEQELVSDIVSLLENSPEKRYEGSGRKASTVGKSIVFKRLVLVVTEKRGSMEILNVRLRIKFNCRDLQSELKGENKRSVDLDKRMEDLRTAFDFVMFGGNVDSCVYLSLINRRNCLQELFDKRI